HATAVAGYLLTNFPDLACFKALASSDLPESSPPLVPGQAMALSLVKFLETKEIPGRLLLPLAGPDIHAAVPGNQQGKKALALIQDLFNDLYRLSRGRIPRGPADLEPHEEVPHAMS
ncbi:MAG: hypothetical protein MI747_03795, partial [Desulfobacterales bacterium]|nr:hypothetical protein [Desulfobacterales bacterium]